MSSGNGWQSAGLERYLLAILIASLAIVLAHQDWLWRWDRLFYDAQLRVWQRPAADDIVIIAIDEQTLQDFGRWPWSRQVHAHLLRLLGEEGPRAIAFDIIFSEPNLQDPAGDTAFAQAIMENGRVILPVLMEMNQVGGQALETLPLPQFANAARAMGHAHIELDRDGIARGLFRYEGLGSPYWPHLSLAMMAIGGEAATATPGSLAGSPVFWYREQPLLIPFAGPPGHFAHISYSRVMNKDYPPGTFHDKYVLIGTTAVGLGDALPTPVSGFSHSMSGVEINANVLDALRRGITIQPLETPWRLLLTGLLALLPFLLYPRRAPRTNFITTGLLLLLTLSVSLGLLTRLHLWFPPTAALLAITLSYPLWSWRRLELAMRYLSQELDRLDQQRARIATGAHLQLADAVGFIQKLLPVSAWCVLDTAGHRIAGSGDLPPAPQRRIPPRAWLAQDGCLWAHVQDTGGDYRVGLRWYDKPRPDAHEQRLLDSLFHLADQDNKASVPDGDSDIQSRIFQVQQATAQLRDLRRFIDDSFANMADGVLAVDSFGRIVLANSRAAWYLKGDDNVALQGSAVIPLLKDIQLDQGETWPDLLRRTMLEGARLQSGARHRNGRDLLVQLAPLNSDGRAPAGLIFNFSDISLLKASERQRNELLHFLSHDLRSPLVSTSALIELARNTHPSTELTGLLDRMERYTGNTLGLAEQFLQLARAESSDTFSFRDVELTGVALNALEQVWGQAQQRHIVLEQRFEVEDAWLQGDAGLLERALINLLDNAIKYSPDGSRVSLTLARENNMLRCCITDQGEGIPADELPRLFERFHRVQKRNNERQRGAGLGLTFVNVVAQRHGGRVDASSTEGHGSCFCLLLPGDV